MPPAGSHAITRPRCYRIEAGLFTNPCTGRITMAKVTRTDTEPRGYRRPMQVDTASFRALNEEITSLNAQLAKHKELYVEPAAEYEVLLCDTSAATYGDERTAGAMRHGKQYLRLVDGAGG